MKGPYKMGAEREVNIANAAYLAGFERCVEAVESVEPGGVLDAAWNAALAAVRAAIAQARGD